MAAKWIDTLLGRVRDARSIDEAKQVFDEFIDPATGAPRKDDDDGDQHIHVHLNGSGSGGEREHGMDDDDLQPGGGADDEVEALIERVEKLEAMMAEMMDGEGEVELEAPGTEDARRYVMRRGKKMRGDKSTRDEDVPEREPEIIGETDLPGIEDLDKRMAAGDRRAYVQKIGKMKTGDSLDMEHVWKDTVALGAIIVPEIRVPTFDGRIAPYQCAKRLCSFRRQVLDKAIKVEDTAKIIKELTGLESLPANLACDTVKMAFTTVGNAIKMSTNDGIFVRDPAAGRTGDGKGRDNGGVKTGTPTIAEIARMNRDAWKDPKSFQTPTR